MTQAFAGIVGIAISAILALVSGRAEANFIPGIVINGVAWLCSSTCVCVWWRSSGVIVGSLKTETTSVSAIRRAKRRVLYLHDLAMGGLFALRLGVEVPLYLARANGTAGTKLLLGIPLSYARECCGDWRSYVPSTEAPLDQRLIRVLKYLDVKMLSLSLPADEDLGLVAGKVVSRGRGWHRTSRKRSAPRSAQQRGRAMSQVNSFGSKDTLAVGSTDCEIFRVDRVPGYEVAITASRFCSRTCYAPKMVQT
jgi:hypothetical protein